MIERNLGTQPDSNMDRTRIMSVFDAPTSGIVHGAMLAYEPGAFPLQSGIAPADTGHNNASERLTIDPVNPATFVPEPRIEVPLKPIVATRIPFQRPEFTGRSTVKSRAQRSLGRTSLRHQDMRTIGLPRKRDTVKEEKL